MHWIQIILETAPQDTEALEDALLAQGALAVTYADAGDQPLFEPDPGETPLWDTVRLIGLFEADAPMQAITEALQSSLGDKMPRYRIEILEDKDWIREWMDQFSPMPFGKRLWICPSWREAPDPQAVNLMLDPGLAFGTGTHPTTALCLQWLDANPPQDLSVTDYGCGSGVLGIAALLLGAHHLSAIDIDPQALQATQQNATQNAIAPDKLGLFLPDQAPAQTTDLVMANILAGPLIQLAGDIGERVKAGGQLILSGILTSQADSVMQAYQPAFDFEPVAEQDGWVRLAGRKRS